VLQGIVVGGWSVMSITWISAAAAVIAIFVFSFARSLSSNDEVSKEEQLMKEEYNIS